MQSLAGRNHHADLLESIPAFAAADRLTLEDYVTHRAVTIHCAAGKVLSAESDRDRNLYVIVSGSAQLRADGDVELALERGDFFGGLRRHASVVIDVVAVTDVEVLVIDPLHITHLTTDHVGVKPETHWTPRRHRRPVLVGAGR
jgi:CRP-like cAMP-binding protein